MPKSGPWFYAVRHGRVPGVYNSWSECETQVKGFCKPTFKKFATFQEAQEFVADRGATNPKSLFQRSFSSSPAVKIECQDNITNDTTASPSTPSLYSKSPHTSYPVTLASLSHEVAKMQCSLNSLLGMTASLSEDVGFVRTAVDRIETAAFIAPGNKRNFSSLARQAGSPKGAKKPREDNINVGGYSAENFTEDEGVHVYTDGGCFGNGRDGAKAGIGVFWGRDDINNVSEALTGRPSNNRAEIHAAVRAVQIAKKKGIKNLIIHTDSQFLINGITKWIKRWKKNGWKLSTGHPVINREDFEALDSELGGISVKWVYVKGHSGNPANEEADRLAKQGAEKAINIKQDLL